MALSPILKNALESLEHAIDHYDLNTDKDRKFAILHADQAIELVLKEAVRSRGVSIFRKDKKTSIGMQEAVDILANKRIEVPYLADLEMLHDERNRIQHQNSSPDADTTTFLIENAVKFVLQFIPAALGLDLRRVVSATAYERYEAFAEAAEESSRPTT